MNLNTILNRLVYLKNYLNIDNIKSATKVFFYSILKQNTRYPNYLLDFEKKVSKYFDSKYALTFSNGTTACNALLYSVGVKKGSKIIISKLTFPSVISSILRIGGKPIFLDFNKDLQINYNQEDSKIIKECDFLLITHAYGIPQNFEIINSILTLNNKLILIEDVSHAQGAKIDNKMLGTLGKGSFMSMQGDKAINAGEGGLVLTNENNIYERLIFLSHLNRKTPINNKLNLLSKIGFIGKGRMSPLGAITALNDIKRLQKRNAIIREKTKILYEGLKNLKNFYAPKINNYENLGGFHYGIPFFADSTLINHLKKFFKISEYNWPILDSNENFKDPSKFLDLLYSDDPKIENVFEKSNDLRDELYFFDLNELIISSKKKIKKKIDLIKKNEN